MEKPARATGETQPVEEAVEAEEPVELSSAFGAAAAGAAGRLLSREARGASSPFLPEAWAPVVLLGPAGRNPWRRW